MKLIAGFTSNKVCFLDFYNNNGMEGFTSGKKEKNHTFFVLSGPGHGRRRSGIDHQPDQGGKGEK